jgi:hypothetical protein
MTAQWHPELNAWIADMSASNGTFLVFGAFQAEDAHRVFQPVSELDQFPLAVVSEMKTVDQPTPPANVDQMTSSDVGLALWKQVVLGPGSSQQYYFFYAVTSSLADAQNVAQAARKPTTPEFWFTQTRGAYQSWLKKASRSRHRIQASASHTSKRLLPTNNRSSPGSDRSLPQRARATLSRSGLATRR